MARTTARRSADKDDPIYKGGFVISSHPVRPKQIEAPEEVEAYPNTEKPKKQD
jgi:hypothetical protein